MARTEMPLRLETEADFRQVYDRHYVVLCRFAAQMLNDASLAEEVVDDVIFYLWEHRSALDIACPLRPYLLRAVRNRCLNELQSSARRRELLLSSFCLPEHLELTECLFVEERHPLGNLLEKELREKLLESIGLLPEACRTVFRKSRFERKKYNEIAAELGISVNTVKYHIKNALAFLQQRLGDYLYVLSLFLGWPE